VLDEADAALEDWSADVYCDLVHSMAANDATRFLVVTHKPLTMARMDRLFGVTMSEPGVSRMARVDVEEAVRLLDDEQAAA
jgi:chromosome segregation protein